MFQHGYYRWNGSRWDGYGSCLSAIGGLIFAPTYWRGVIPNEEYPFDQVEPNGLECEANKPILLTGTLGRKGAPDKITIRCFELTGSELKLEFVRELGKRDPEEYKCTLIRQGDEYAGVAKAKIQGFVLDKATHIRMRMTTATGGTQVLIMLDAARLLVFSGILAAPGVGSEIS